MSATVARGEKRWVWRWAILVVVLACLPYLLAWLLAPADVQYTGLLINHFDGESYYAKMQQGARGDWLFRLPFTPETQAGAPVYLFYLALGHLAGILGLPIPLVYHLARAAAALFLLLVSYRFIARFFVRVSIRRVAFLLLAFSAGFGWLLAPLGIILADLWVAEGFLFLSILTNPHFPLVIALMLLLFMVMLDLGIGEPRPARLAQGAALSFALALIQPFPLPIVLAAAGAYLVLRFVVERHFVWGQALVVGAMALGAAPMLAYYLYVYGTDPAIAAWSAQNVTSSLPPWNYALGYGLVFLLALPGMVVAARRRRPSDLFLLAWAGSAIVLLYVPFALQRRFITGLHVPLVLLAALALDRVVWPRLAVRRRGLVLGLLVGVGALSNVFVILVAVLGVAQGQAPLVMSAEEAAACAWLGENTAWTDTVLAPVEMGQFIPAWAGNRVVYGHPFETIDAETKEAEVEQFYSPAATPAERQALLERYGVRYVLVAHPDGIDLDSLGLQTAWASQGTVLYRVAEVP